MTDYSKQWRVTDTGGGCTALIAEYKGWHALITSSADGMEPDHDDATVDFCIYQHDPEAEGMVGGYDPCDYLTLDNDHDVLHRAWDALIQARDAGEMEP